MELVQREFESIVNSKSNGGSLDNSNPENEGEQEFRILDERTLVNVS